MDAQTLQERVQAEVLLRPGLSAGDLARDLHVGHDRVGDAMRLLKLSLMSQRWRASNIVWDSYDPRGRPQHFVPARPGFLMLADAAVVGTWDKDDAPTVLALGAIDALTGCAWYAAFDGQQVTVRDALMQIIEQSGHPDYLAIDRGGDLHELRANWPLPRTRLVNGSLNDVMGMRRIEQRHHHLRRAISKHHINRFTDLPAVQLALDEWCSAHREKPTALGITRLDLWAEFARRPATAGEVCMLGKHRATEQRTARAVALESADGLGLRLTHEDDPDLIGWLVRTEGTGRYHDQQPTGSGQWRWLVPGAKRSARSWGEDEEGGRDE